MAWPGNIDQTIFTTNGMGKKWMHAICLAVNERQELLGVAKTQFMKSDGTTGEDLVLSDFAGIWTTQLDPRFNLETAQAAIKSICTAFGPDPGFTPRWTVSSLETDIGLGAFPDNMEKIQDLNYWKRLKEALDRMIYASSGDTLNWAGAEVTTYRLDGFDPNANDAWDEMLADATPTFNGYTGTFGFGGEQGISGANYTAESYYADGSITVDFSHLSLGSPSTMSWNIQWQTSNNEYVASALTIDVGSSSYSRTTFTGPTSTTENEGDLADITFAGTTTVSINSTPPATWPFSFPTPDLNAYSSSIYAKVISATVYYDISAHLTDQA